MLMSGYEPVSSVVGSDHSANCAKTTVQCVTYRWHQSDPMLDLKVAQLMPKVAKIRFEF